QLGGERVASLRRLQPPGRRVPGGLRGGDTGGAGAQAVQPGGGLGQPGGEVRLGGAGGGLAFGQFREFAVQGGEPVAQPLGAVLLGDELLQGGQVVSVGAFEPGQRLFEFSRGGAGFRGGGEGGRQGLQGRGEVGAGGLEVGGDGVPAADGGQGARRGVQPGLCGGAGGGRAGGLLQSRTRLTQAVGQCRPALG